MRALIGRTSFFPRVYYQTRQTCAMSETMAIIARWYTTRLFRCEITTCARFAFGCVDGVRSLFIYDLRDRHRAQNVSRKTESVFMSPDKFESTPIFLVPRPTNVARRCVIIRETQTYTHEHTHTHTIRMTMGALISNKRTVPCES